MNIHEKIKEIQDYFKAKLLAGEFEEEEIDSNCIRIEIDGYGFNLWSVGVSQSIEISTCVYGRRGGICDFLNDRDKEAFWYNYLSPRMEAFKKEKADADFQKYLELKQKYEKQ